MRIPRKLWIDGKRWTVEPLSKKDAKKFCGRCIRSTNTIYIDFGLPADEIEDTLIHEILHAVWPLGIVSEKKEEKLIRQISYGLLEVFKKNGVFTK